MTNCCVPSSIFKYSTKYPFAFLYCCHFAEIFSFLFAAFLTSSFLSRNVLRRRIGIIQENKMQTQVIRGLDNFLSKGKIAQGSTIIIWIATKAVGNIIVPNEITATIELKFVGKCQIAWGPPMMLRIETARNMS